MPISIGIAGNTILPTLLAIKTKGYKITQSYTEIDGELEATFLAEKENCRFSANNPEELLGLIAMWEVRGDDWKYDPKTETDIQRELTDSAIIYDLDGNVIEE
jgi:hypothetical protein